MRYLSVEDVLYIYESEIGKPPVVLDFGKLEAAVGRPQYEFFGEAQYPTLVEKGAALLHSLIEGHAFQDGNKRTATVALEIFMGSNGRPTKWDREEAKTYFYEIAQGVHSISEIAEWLDANTESEAQE